MDIIKSCTIMSNLSLNVSDHYPLCTTLHFSLTSDANVDTGVNIDRPPKYPVVNWSDDRICSAYSNYVTEAARSLQTCNIDDVSNRDVACKVVESMCNDAVNIMHKSCKMVISDSHQRYKGRYKKNNWWNNDCLMTRDRQRFWFRIWKSCGRPRTGQIYLCYKTAKKTYRYSCNRAMNSKINSASYHLN